MPRFDTFWLWINGESMNEPRSRDFPRFSRAGCIAACRTRTNTSRGLIFDEKEKKREREVAEIRFRVTWETTLFPVGWGQRLTTSSNMFRTFK